LICNRSELIAYVEQ